jgi:hypothetical protein
MTETVRVDAAEAVALSERAWASWQRRRLMYFAVPAVLLIPAAIFAIVRDPEEGETDWMGMAMLAFFALGFLSILWVRWQMPLSPPRVRTMAEQGSLSPNHVERLRRQAAR